MPFNQSGAFSLLGAPIGDAGFCNEFTAAEWVNKALPLLEELAVLDDAQTTLLLLRQCASYCRMVYSTRVTPPRGLAPALQSFDTAVHGCLEAGCSGPLTPEAWMQASLSTRSGGLGLRSVARHGVAGYAASLLATAPCAKTSMATMMQTRAPPCTRSTSRSHLPTTSRSQPRTLLGNKSCHARWTGLWSRSWPPRPQPPTPGQRLSLADQGPQGWSGGGSTWVLFLQLGGHCACVVQQRWGSQGGAGSGKLASAASEQQRLCRADRASALCISSGRLWRVAGMASHNSSRSPASQRAQRRWVNWAACRRCRRPPRGAGRSTALGSMKRSRQACKLLVLATCARARERHWAQTARAALGTCRRTGVFAAQAVSKEGPATAGAAAAGLPRQLDEQLAGSVDEHHCSVKKPTPAHRAQVKVLAGTVSLRDVPIKRPGRVVLEMGPHSGMAGPVAAARHAGRASWDRAENAVRGALAGRGRTFPARAARSVDCHGLPLAAQRCTRGRWPRVERLADAAASKAAASAESLHPTMRRTPGHPRGPMPTPRRGRERPPPHGKRRRASRPSNQKRWCESLPPLAVGRPWQLR